MHKITHKSALIFDMDGVIVNNISYHYKALKLFFEKFNKPLNQDLFQKEINGRTMQEIVKMVKPDATLNEINSLTEEKEAIYREVYKNDLQPTAGLLDLLKQAKDKNLKMAVATSAIAANVDFTLDGLGIRHYFDCIIDSSMVQKGKPEPEVYLKAAECLNTSTNECVVFEDALAGIQAAHNAGIEVIGLATSLEMDELPKALLFKTKDFTNVSV